MWEVDHKIQNNSYGKKVSACLACAKIYQKGLVKLQALRVCINNNNNKSSVTYNINKIVYIQKKIYKKIMGLLSFCHVNIRKVQNLIKKKLVIEFLF